MNRKNLTSNDWADCPPGTLRGFAGKQRQQKQLRRLALGGSTVVALLLLAVTLRGFLVDGFSTGEPNFGGVTCSVVRSKIQLYHQQKLDPALTASIRQHLSECGHCQRDLHPPAAKQATKPHHLVVLAEVVP